jgi:hypothetical protein
MKIRLKDRAALVIGASATVEPPRTFVREGARAGPAK